MKLESKRIFISDLPETATQEELQNAFRDYGNVKSIEIKERKELGPKNSSLFFSYVNLETDDRQLQKCFQDFENGKLHGEYLTLQVARESFLDRLKREREANSGGTKTINSSKPVEVLQQPVLTRNQVNGAKIVRKSSSESSSSSEDDELQKKSIAENKSLKISKEEVKFEESEERIDIIIKNNKGKFQDRNALKIESVGNEPIIRIDLSKKKVTNSNSEANLKRLESLKNLKKGYRNQKSLIQAALSNVDNKASNKIIFHDDNKEKSSTRLNENNTNLNNDLFDGNDSGDDYEANFDVREEFQTEEGQKLLQLESRYKNDKRFALDSRFLNEQEETERQVDGEDDEITLEEEKKKEYEILEQVLGKKINPKPKLIEKDGQRKTMLRFDPTQPEHSKYEIPKPEKKEKRKRKNSENDILNEKKQEEKDMPEVSKEVFYKVTNDLKETLEEKKEFSLLSMFGHTEETEKEKQPPEATKILSNNFASEKNPFRYDSSDDEDEKEDVPDKNDMNQIETAETAQSSKNNRVISWTDPFFFRNDDYRLQEGFDFVEKMKLEEKTEFSKLRRHLKEIVKAKVRNNQKKKQPFKKKLGGSKRKKVMRLKKAMKR
ncbi:unnamed protein product [Phaedon cochleariae]|uniref:RRM domain-containing protein n=1 Tax=Phaedon cochleariae TaxID=80249 RepID=A0A9P0DPM0_PHACE|nr:unnamed protein product [Phaedon cochleariae]